MDGIVEAVGVGSMEVVARGGRWARTPTLALMGLSRRNRNVANSTDQRILSSL
jgi:hypothetical protein